MDHERIDRLSRALAVPGLLSRRGALAVLGTTMFGMVGGTDAEPTRAKRKPRQHHKRETRHRGMSKSRRETKLDSRDADAQLHAAKRKKQHKSKKQRHGGDQGRSGATSPGDSSTQPAGTPPPTCVPQCAATNACGDDGCSGTCGACTDQGAATCRTTGACHDGHCELYASGTTCQAATCTSGTTLQPACTCDGQGGCDCPAQLTCPNDLVCRNGACLTSCGNGDDCVKGLCQPDGRCAGCRLNLDGCSGHGVISDSCACVCDAGWGGRTCAIEQVTPCSEYATCGECQTHLVDGSCVWCIAESAVGCSRSDDCAIFAEICPSGG